MKKNDLKDIEMALLKNLSTPGEVQAFFHGVDCAMKSMRGEIEDSFNAAEGVYREVLASVVKNHAKNESAYP